MKLIDKDAAVAIIKHHIKEETHSYFCKCLLSEIDALEVKEVDLEKYQEYLRKENEGFEMPTGCSMSNGFDGVVYDLRETPHNEVMKFCENLARVYGKTYEFYYSQYVKIGKVIL